MPRRITLDTGVARECCYAEPPWLAEFVALSTDGWSFHLTDICVAELIAALERNAISVDQWNLCITRLTTFVSDWLPCLPGKRQLFHLCECKDLEDPNKEQDSVEFREAYSKAVWQMLQQLALPPDSRREIVFEADGKKFKCPINVGAAEQELVEERIKWVNEMEREPNENFQFESEVAAIKKDFDIWVATSGPPMSVRADILAYTQAEWERRIANGYSPSSNNRRNDGIDFLLHFAFMWPAILVTTDCGVHRFLRGLGSFQSTWVFLPNELAASRENGELIEPNWPTTEAESGPRD